MQSESQELANLSIHKEKTLRLGQKSPFALQ
jgi:hypothetical protein